MDIKSTPLLKTPNSKIRCNNGCETLNPEDDYPYLNGNLNQQFLVSPNLQMHCQCLPRELHMGISPFNENLSKFSSSPYNHEKLDSPKSANGSEKLGASQNTSIPVNFHQNIVVGGSYGKISLSFSTLGNSGLSPTFSEKRRKSARPLVISNICSLSFEIRTLDLLDKKEKIQTQDAQVMCPEIKNRKEPKPVQCKKCQTLTILPSYRHLGGHMSRNHPNTIEELEQKATNRKKREHNRLVSLIKNLEYYKRKGINYSNEYRTKQGKIYLKKLKDPKEFREISKEIEKNFDFYFDYYSSYFSDVASIVK